MASQTDSNKIQRAVDLISKARYFIAFTGAGISTPSGIPDFRSKKEGLWTRYDPMQVASRTSFYHSPELFYDWFRPLFITSWNALPNPAHAVLAALEKQGMLRTVITQNIDGLHQKAGSSHILELHGTALNFKCTKCKIDISGEAVFDQFKQGKLIPICSHCETILKPDVVLFEEELPHDILLQAQSEAIKADLILIIGSSLEVFPANSIPQAAVRNGCKLIINNFSSTPMDAQANLQISMDAAVFLPLLIEQLSK